LPGKEKKSHASANWASYAYFLQPYTSRCKLFLALVHELPSPNKDEDTGQDRNGKQDILNHPAPSPPFTSSLSPSFLPASIICTQS